MPLAKLILVFYDRLFGYRTPPLLGNTLKIHLPRMSQMKATLAGKLLRMAPPVCKCSKLSGLGGATNSKPRVAAMASDIPSNNASLIMSAPLVEQLSRTKSQLSNTQQMHGGVAFAVLTNLLFHGRLRNLQIFHVLFVIS